MVNKGYALIDASTDKLDISVIPVDDIIKSETFTDVEIDEGGTLNATTVLSALASNILESNQESLIDGTTPNYEIQDLKCQAVTFIVDTANTSGHFEDINENPLSIGGAPEDARDNFLIQPSHKVFLNSGENNYEVYINVINNTGSGDNDVEISDTNGETVTIPTGSYSVTAINGIEIFQFSGDYYARKTRVGTENTVTFGTSTGTENNLGLYSIRQIIKGSDLEVNGTRFRVVLQTSDSNQIEINNMSIQERLTACDGTGTPVEITFDKTSGITWNQGTTTSDWIDFNIDIAKDYIITMDINSSGLNHEVYFSADSGYDVYLFETSATYNDNTVSDSGEDLQVYTTTANAGVYDISGNTLIEALLTNGTATGTFTVLDTTDLNIGDTYLLKADAQDDLHFYITNIEDITGSYRITVNIIPAMITGNRVVFISEINVNTYLDSGIPSMLQGLEFDLTDKSIDSFKDLQLGSTEFDCAITPDGHTYMIYDTPNVINIASDLNSIHGGVEGNWYYYDDNTSTWKVPSDSLPYLENTENNAVFCGLISNENMGYDSLMAIEDLTIFGTFEKLKIAYKTNDSYSDESFAGYKIKYNFNANINLPFVNPESTEEGILCATTDDDLGEKEYIIVNHTIAKIDRLVIYYM